MGAIVSSLKKAIQRLLGFVSIDRSIPMKEDGSTSDGIFRIKQKHLAILRQAGVTVDPYSKTSGAAAREIREQLYNGVLLENGTQKFWVDRRKKKDCYAVFARGLSVTSGDDPSYWQWHTDDKDAEGEVAELVRVMWLEVQGKFNTLNLERNTRYRVSFVVKLRMDSEMKGLPLTLRLSLPDGSTQSENQRSVEEEDQWVELVAGEFSTSVTSIDGDIHFCLEEISPSWKSGLVIKGVEVKPVD